MPGESTETGAGGRGLRYFDSHLHLTDPRFEGERGEVLRRAREAGVTGLVTIGTAPEDAREALALVRETEGLWATAGLHPHRAHRDSTALRREIADLAREDGVVAVGETGLDYHYDNSPRDAQRRSFGAHLRLAEETGLPVVVHAREADEDAAAAIREVEGRVRGVLHCFTAGSALLETGLEAGWHVSFSGIVTFASDVAAHVPAVPDERLLIETDSPYLTPEPRRGRRNEPAYLPYTCRKVAALREADEEWIATLTRRNALAFYRLPESFEASRRVARGPDDA